MKHRAFLAIDIPVKVQQALGNLINDLKKMESGVSWGKPEQFHVTLRFFGDVEEDLLLGNIATEIERVTSSMPSHRLECEGVGVFPNWKYPRIIWAGFAGDTEPTLTLHDRLSGALKPFPLKPDDRVFRLHLTIGRAKNITSKGQLVKTVESLGPVRFGAVPIGHITMYKSQLTRGGAIYTPLKIFVLTKP